VVEVVTSEKGGILPPVATELFARGQPFAD